MPKPVDDFEHVHFRVSIELRKKIERLKEMADCKTDAEYFRFLVRQELKNAGGFVSKQK